jgi:serine/threonine protein kinase
MQFPHTPVDALDLMRKMLETHPRKRITVEDSLAHPFLAQLHTALMTNPSRKDCLTFLSRKRTCIGSDYKNSFGWRLATSPHLVSCWHPGEKRFNQRERILELGIHINSY